MKNSEKRKKNTTVKRKIGNVDHYLKEKQVPDVSTVTDKRIQQFANELVKGALSGKYDSLNWFRASNYIPCKTWREWREKYTFVEAANSIAKEAIIARRIKLAQEKRCDSKLISDSQTSFYCDEFKEHYKWMKSLDEEKQNKVSMVVLESTKEYEKFLEDKADPYDKE